MSHDHHIRTSPDADPATDCDAHARSLVARMRRGDRAAFLAFYDLHAAPVLGFLASAPDAGHLPEDVLADVFTTALLTPEQPCPHTTVEAWLFGIARQQTGTSTLRVA